MKKEKRVLWCFPSSKEAFALRGQQYLSLLGENNLPAFGLAEAGEGKKQELSVLVFPPVMARPQVTPSHRGPPGSALPSPNRLLAAAASRPSPGTVRPAGFAPAGAFLRLDAAREATAHGPPLPRALGNEAIANLFRKARQPTSPPLPPPQPAWQYYRFPCHALPIS